MILERLDENVTVISAETAVAGLDLYTQTRDINLVLLDYNLPDMSGLDCLGQMQAYDPSISTIMLSAEEDANLIQHVLHKGAKGFITKTSSSDVMISAIKLVLSGGVYIPPVALTQTAPVPAITEEQLAPPLTPGVDTTPQPSSVQLTERQIDVLNEMAKGLSNKEIARLLDMSPSTVKVHVAAILKSFNVKNRTQAVNFAIENQLITPET